MNLLLHIFKQKYPYFKNCLPYIALALWVGVLLVATNGQQSLMAHDEGWYATQARWMFETGDWITPRWWGIPIYDRMIGIHWAIAACYSLFGITDGVARLPNLIACIGAVFLTYEIGVLLINRRIALLGSAILGLCPLWLQYSRMATQDIPLICVELLGIWALLKGESNLKSGWKWRILAGSTVGIGFMIKSTMIVLPIVALIPYLVWRHHRHHHLTNSMLHLGLILGSIPTAVWFGLTYQKYGISPFQEMFAKIFALGSKQYHSDGNAIYYLWNIPLNSFPWGLFAIFGIIILWNQLSIRHQDKTNSSYSNRQFENQDEIKTGKTTELLSQKPINKQQLESQTSISILIFYPLLLFVFLTSFATRTAYYSLQIYPFISLLAAICLDWLVHKPQAHSPKIISYIFGGLGLILLLTFTFINMGVVTISDEIRKHLLIVPILGIGWTSLPFLWHQYQQEYRKISKYQFSKLFQSKSFLALLIVFLITPWLTFTTAGILGLWGNYSTDLRSYLQQPAIADILQAQPINFVTQNINDGEIHKTWVLLSFYTPHLGRAINSVSELPSASYAWISPNVAVSQREKSLGNIRGWQLIKVQN